MTKAIRQYIAFNEWRIAEIRKGLAEAEQCDFASEEDVRRVMSKWTGRRKARLGR
jgi:predicted transcriptional regulator